MAGSICSDCNSHNLIEQVMRITCLDCGLVIYRTNQENNRDWVDWTGMIHTRPSRFGNLWEDHDLLEDLTEPYS
jgi:transcription initiation factor TFIIIB Brf1 subunit/transcription initiation factor TFIIB